MKVVLTTDTGEIECLMADNLDLLSTNIPDSPVAIVLRKDTGEAMALTLNRLNALEFSKRIAAAANKEHH